METPSGMDSWHGFVPSVADDARPGLDFVGFEGLVSINMHRTFILRSEFQRYLSVSFHSEVTIGNSELKKPGLALISIHSF